MLELACLDSTMTLSWCRQLTHGSGQTGWAPIMGVGYYRSLSQWSKGEYLSANNSQDDLAIISGAVGYAIDDHGNTAASATQLSVGATGAIANTGLISTRTDQDAFKFATQTGIVSIDVAPFDYSTGKGNLDVVLTLVNSLGTVVSVVNSASIINATLTTSLPKGIYSVIVDGVGKTAVAGDEGYSDYASIGKYSLSGNVVPNRSPLAVADSVTTGVGNSILIDVLLNDTDADQDTVSILSVGAPSVGTVSIEAGKIRYVPPSALIGQATFAYTIADELGATSTGSVTITLIPNVPPTVGVNQLAVTGNEGTLVSNTGTWADSDLPANTVALTASIGTIVKNADGTWSWQIAATDQVPATNVIVTANDGLGGIASTSFTFEAINLPPTLTRNVSIVSGSVLTTLANGLVLDVAGLAFNSLGAGDFGLRMSPSGFFNESTNPLSNWAAAPSPTGIFVTLGTATTPAPAFTQQSRFRSSRLEVASLFNLEVARCSISLSQMTRERSTNLI